MLRVFFSRLRQLPLHSWPARMLVFTLVWAGASAALTPWLAPPSPPPPADRPLVAPVENFALSASCRACHPGNYASWHASFHRTMTQPATPATVLPPMDGLELTLDGVLYRVDREADTFVVRTRPASNPQAAFTAPQKIVLLTGSHNQQVFWLSSGAGRSVEPFPFGWLVAEKMWAPSGDTFLSPPDLETGRGTGLWNNGCINCHTTQGQPRFAGGEAFDSQVLEFGISCASCHGEAAAHIEKHRNPLRRYVARLSDDPDPSIVNPARLAGPASSLACGQCHSVWAFDSATAAQTWDKNGPRFRPGQTELPDRFIVQPADPAHPERPAKLDPANPHLTELSFWPDGRVRVTGREYNGVQASPCFQGGNFSCLSCHEMHPAKTDTATLQSWAAGQMKPHARTDADCLQCHAPIAANISAHTHHAPESAGSRCYDCHMPHTSFGLLRAVRSHQVSSPNVDESLRHGRPNACNLCHLDQPLAWTAGKLRDWYGQPVPALSADDTAIAASVLWILKGDAGQRALVSWSMGWAPAQQASGRDWLAPYLSIALNDPYAAVRFAAWKSLRTLPGFESFDYVYTAEDAVTYEAAMRAYDHSTQLQFNRGTTFPPTVLLNSLGRFDSLTYNRLLDERNHRRVFLIE